MIINAREKWAFMFSFSFLFLTCAESKNMWSRDIQRFLSRAEPTVTSWKLAPFVLPQTSNTLMVENQKLKVVWKIGCEWAIDKYQKEIHRLKRCIRNLQAFYLWTHKVFDGSLGRLKTLKEKLWYHTTKIGNHCITQQHPLLRTFVTPFKNSGSSSLSNFTHQHGSSL